MSIFFLVCLIAIPLVFGLFFFWRSYQLGINGRVSLTRQWLIKPPEGIESFASLFAWRDFIFGCGMLLFLCLLLTQPKYLSAWISMLGLFGVVYQGFTNHVINKLKK